MHMSAEPAAGSSADPVWKRHVLAFFLFLVAISSGWDGLRTVPDPPKAFRDFAMVQSGAECLLDRCDPYSATAIVQENAGRRELKVAPKPEWLVYPPSTFLVLLPLACAGWPGAGFLWCWIGVVLLATACAALVEVLELERHLVVLLPLLALLTSTPVHLPISSPYNVALRTGNPTLVAVPLVSLACSFLFGRSRLPVAAGAKRSMHGWMLMGLALALKPQIAVGALLALITRAGRRLAESRPTQSRPTEIRKDAFRAVLLAVAVLTLAIVLFWYRLGSLAFFAQMIANNRTALQPGHSSDISMAGFGGNSQTGLQRIAYFFGAQAPWPALLAWSVVAAAILCAFMINRRTGAWRRLAWCPVALLVLLSVMPVYHGSYDRLLLLVMLPAFAELHALGQKAIAWLLSILGAFWVGMEQIFNHVLGRANHWPVKQTVPLLLCALLLWGMAVLKHDEMPRADA